MTSKPIHDATIKTHETIPSTQLTAHDRCDAGGCGAQAYVRVLLQSSLELLFCGHHWAEKRKLIGAVINVQDDTGTITKARDKQ